MLKITSKLPKNQFFSELSKEAFGSGELEIFVDSFPIYLNTEVAFKIFLHQTKTYPRQIIWLTSSPDILDFLKKVNVNVEPIGIFHEENFYGNSELSQSPNLPVDFSDFSKPLDEPETKVTEFKKPIQDLYSAEPVKTAFEKELLYSQTNLNQKLIQSEDLFSSSHYNPSSLILSNYNPYREDSESLDIKNQNSNSETFEKTEDSSFQDNFTKTSSASFASNNQTSKEDIISSDSKSQSKIYGQDIASFDDWLEKIEETKQTLENLKQKSKVNQKPRVKVSSPRIFSFYKRMRIPKAATALLTVSLLFFGISFAFAAFPSQVYTLELQEEKGRSQIQLDFPINKVNLRSSRFLAEGSVATSGVPDKPKDPDLAQGKIQLINSSGSDIQITNGKFYLDAPNGSRYRPKYNDSLDETIVISGGGGSIEFDIFSIYRGSGYDQAKDTTFVIRNNNLSSMGAGLRGKSLTSISLPVVKTGKYFTNEDKNRLIANVNQDLSTQREEELKKISGGNIISHVDWYRNINRKDNFSHKTGQVSETVKLNSDLESNIYYLFENQISEKIKESDSEISLVSEIQILDYSADFSDEGFLNITASYKFSNDKEIDSKEIEKKFSNDDFASVQNELKDEYPNIIKIQKTESGMRIPGIKPRVDVAIVQKNPEAE